METIKNEQIYAFDSLYTTNHIQMLKILLPCLNPPLQKNLALYIKFLELRYTISFLHTHPCVISGCGFDKKYREQEIPVGDLLPYLTPQEAENLKQLQKSMNIMKQFSNMQKNMEALKGILPEGMDLETLFQGMMNGMQGAGAEESGSDSVDHSSQSSGSDGMQGGGKSDASETDHENTGKPKSAFSMDTGKILQNMMQNASSGDVLKNMMSDSQMELYQKFNERFQNL